jgi:hypothetical protein
MNLPTPLDLPVFWERYEKEKKISKICECLSITLQNPLRIFLPAGLIRSLLSWESGRRSAVCRAIYRLTSYLRRISPVTHYHISCFRSRHQAYDSFSSVSDFASSKRDTLELCFIRLNKLLSREN